MTNLVHNRYAQRARSLILQHFPHNSGVGAELFFVVDPHATISRPCLGQIKAASSGFNPQNSPKRRASCPASHDRDCPQRSLYTPPRNRPRGSILFNAERFSRGSPTSSPRCRRPPRRARRSTSPRHSVSSSKKGQRSSSAAAVGAARIDRRLPPPPRHRALHQSV